MPLYNHQFFALCSYLGHTSTTMTKSYSTTTRYDEIPLEACKASQHSAALQIPITINVSSHDVRSRAPKIHTTSVTVSNYAQWRITTPT